MKGPQAPSDRILISIPFWKGDRNQAGLLAKLLADLEPRHSTAADILFTSRFDCPPLSKDAIRYVSRKFNVHQHRSARRETGWPNGCNGLFFGALEYIYSFTAVGKIPNYAAILNMASDVVPLQRDWVAQLHKSLISLKSKGSISSAGALIDGLHPHINGDAFLFWSEDLLRWLLKEVNGVSVRAGWDWILAPDFQRRGWANLPSIRSLWNTPTMSLATAKQLRKEGVVLLHGVKDDSLLNHARKLLL